MRSRSSDRFDQDPAVEYIWAPLHYNNFITFVERLIHVLKSDRVGPLLRRKILQEAPKSLAACSGRLTPGEIAQITKDLRAARLTAVMEGMTFSSPSDRGALRPGEGFCLCVVEGMGEPPFGCVLPLCVTAQPGKVQAVIIPKNVPERSQAAVIFAYNAVFNYLKEKGLQGPGVRRFNRYDLNIRVGDADRVPDGLSLGVPIALAMLSALLQHPLPPRIAATGDLLPNGRIEEVGGIREKIEEALAKGFTRIYIPKKNSRSVPEDCFSWINGVESLDQIASKIFPEEILSHYILASNGDRRKPRIGDLAGTLLKKGPKVLISVVGERDPYASDRRTEETTEGAILTAFRTVQPDAVLLFSANEAMGKKHGKPAVEMLKKLGNSRTTVVHRSLRVKDPTLYDELFERMNPIIKAFIAKLPFSKKQSTFYLSISSGTPQMHAVWIHIVRSGILPAVILQVREPRFVSPGEDRVRLVRSRHLNLTW